MLQSHVHWYFLYVASHFEAVWWPHVKVLRCPKRFLILDRHFGPWRWGQFVASKCRESIIQWCGIISQNNRIASYTTVRTSTLAHYMLTCNDIVWGSVNCKLYCHSAVTCSVYCRLITALKISVCACVCLYYFVWNTHLNMWFRLLSYTVL